MSKLIYEVKFKGQEGVGEIAAKDEDAVRRMCKRMFSGKLLTVKYKCKLVTKDKKEKK